ncbi:hydrogenase [Tepiditoga spiralis]|uniref:Hydrogenase n=1 Tax=Tepiditoga spiralis TaxID=2108365 RepID=A0A7G1G536_9BACT|nr:NADH-quinone oxidoreductase subunit H [Tepiditoga spiralis]BBE31511.1 hydrogenase [Tepiditoga spiralis]
MKSIILFILTIFLSPLFSGIILKTKAFFSGKKGPSIFINYYTLKKLLFNKGSVYSSTTTFIFKIGPIISFTVALIALMFFPIAGFNSILSFNGDIVFIIYLMGLSRFFTIISAMDTGSSFEGMGGSREGYYSALAELTLFMSIISLVNMNGYSSFMNILNFNKNIWSDYGLSLILIIISLFMILLTENSRVPVDDPKTHLELTMIHEVMVLDHSGPDLGFIHFGANLKLMFYAAFIAKLLMFFSFNNFYLDTIIFYGIIFLIYVFIGVIESLIPRFKFEKVPKFILTSFSLSILANILVKGFLK